MELEMNSSPKAARGSALNCTLCAIFLILMSIQIVPLEGRSVGPIKVAAMCLAPLIFLLRGFILSRALVLGGISIVWFFGCLFLQFNVTHFERMGHLAMFIVSYVTFYNLIAKGAFSIDFFLRLIQALLSAYIAVLILQQALSLAKLAPMPLINLWNVPRPLLKCPSLAIEPSQSARIMTAAFYAFLKVSEIRNKGPLSVRQLFGNHMLLTCGFVYAMLSMCSGTAVIGLALLSLYFLRKKYVLFLIPLSAVLFFVAPKLAEMEQVNRVQATLDAVTTFDEKKVSTADHSASFRIIPLINLFKMDFHDKTTWFGHGTLTDVEAYYIGASSRRVPVNVYEYGLIAYVIAQIFIFVCCIPGVFSIGSLIYLVMCTFVGFSNNAVFWGVYLILTCIKHFQREERNALPADSQAKQRLRRFFCKETPSL